MTQIHATDSRRSDGSQWRNAPAEKIRDCMAVEIKRRRANGQFNDAARKQQRVVHQLLREYVEAAPKLPPKRDRWPGWRDVAMQSPWAAVACLLLIVGWS